MWQRFTERARRSILLGQVQALQMQETEVRPEHLLLGLLEDSGCVAAIALKDLGVTFENTRPEVALLSEQTSPSPPQMLSISDVEALGTQFQVPTDLVRQIESQLLLKLRGQSEVSITRRFPFKAKERKDKSDILLASSTKRVLELAAKEARRLHHNYIGTEHMLLGLLNQNSGATKLLLDAGLTLEQIRSAVLPYLASDPNDSPDGPPIAAP